MPALVANLHTDFTCRPRPVQLYPSVKMKASCVSDSCPVGFFLVGRRRYILSAMASSFLDFISKPENFQWQINVFLGFGLIRITDGREER